MVVCCCCITMCWIIQLTYILAVGSIMGFIYGKCLAIDKDSSLVITGTVTIFQYGAGTAGVFRTLGKYMGASGGMFA